MHSPNLVVPLPQLAMVPIAKHVHLTSMKESSYKEKGEGERELDLEGKGTHKQHLLAKQWHCMYV